MNKYSYILHIYINLYKHSCLYKIYINIQIYRHISIYPYLQKTNPCLYHVPPFFQHPHQNTPPFFNRTGIFPTAFVKCFPTVLTSVSEIWGKKPVPTDVITTFAQKNINLNTKNHC